MRATWSYSEEWDSEAEYPDLTDESYIESEDDDRDLVATFQTACLFRFLDVQSLRCWSLVNRQGYWNGPFYGLFGSQEAMDSLSAILARQAESLTYEGSAA